MRIGRGTALALLAGLTYLLAWNRGINLLYGMFALLAATLAVARWRATRSLVGIEAQRSLPSAAFENDEIEIVVTVANRSRHTRRMIETRDDLPCASEEQRRPTTFVGRLKGGAVRRLASRCAAPSAGSTCRARCACRAPTARHRHGREDHGGRPGRRCSCTPRSPAWRRFRRSSVTGSWAPGVPVRGRRGRGVLRHARVSSRRQPAPRALAQLRAPRPAHREGV